MQMNSKYNYEMFSLFFIYLAVITLMTDNTQNIFSIITKHSGLWKYTLN